MLLFWFQNTHPSFAKDLIEQIQKNEMKAELKIPHDEVPIITATGSYLTPYVDKNKVLEIHETFLSYVWCVSYSIYVLFLETIDYPKVNAEVGYEKYKVTPEEIEKAKEMFNYAKSLIKSFSVWDKDKMPNPESYLAEKRNYVEQTNLFYTDAVKFILCHEYTHIKKHIDKIDHTTPHSHFLDMEKEADSDALALVKMGIIPEYNEWSIKGGVVIAMLSMFYFSEVTTGKKHPSTEDRLTFILEDLDLPDDDFVWAFACIGLKLWDEQFGLNFKWEKANISYKELYYRIVAEIKAKH